MKVLSFYFKLFIIIALFNGSYNYQSTCSIQKNVTIIYALCSGSFTLENSTNACKLNGYVLVADNESINTIIHNFYYK